MHIMIAGDTHGNLRHCQNVLIRDAVNAGITEIYQVGDFGFVWSNRQGELNGNLYLLSEMLVKNGLTLRFIAGNHEDYTLLESLGAFEDNEEMTEIAPNIFHIPRAFVWEVDGVRFMGFGGAASTDRGMGDPYWWPNEQITWPQGMRGLNAGKVDIMLCHDGITEDGGILSNHMLTKNPFRFRHPESEANREIIHAVAEATETKYLFHGHHHIHYNDVIDNIAVHGVGCDGMGKASYKVIDIERMIKG